MPRIGIQIIPEQEPHAGCLDAFVIAEAAQPPATSLAKIEESAQRWNDRITQ